MKYATLAAATRSGPPRTEPRTPHAGSGVNVIGDGGLESMESGTKIIIALLTNAIFLLLLPCLLH